MDHGEVVFRNVFKRACSTVRWGAGVPCACILFSVNGTRSGGGLTCRAGFQLPPAPCPMQRDRRPGGAIIEKLQSNLGTSHDVNVWAACAALP